MVLASVLAEASLVATKLHTAATVTLEQQYGKIVITKVHLELLAKVPSVNVEAFRKFARVARGKCPLTRLLNVEVTLDIGIVND